MAALRREHSLVARRYDCQGVAVRNLAAGAYRLAITAQNNTAGTYAALISLVPADVTATTAPDGKPVRLSTSAVEILLPQPLELLILGRGQQVGPLSAIGRSPGGHHRAAPRDARPDRR